MNITKEIIKKDKVATIRLKVFSEGVNAVVIADHKGNVSFSANGTFTATEDGWAYFVREVLSAQHDAFVLSL